MHHPEKTDEALKNGQSRENLKGNQEWTIQRKQATLSTQDTGRRQTKQKNTTQKTKKMSNIDPTKNGG
jgi:hypothetical protein